MTTSIDQLPSVLGLFPNSEGYAFAFFESPKRLVDWGTFEAPGKANLRNRRSMLGIERLLDELHPEVLLLEDYDGEDSRRTKRIRRLHQSIEAAAEKRGFEIDVIPLDDVYAAFEGASSTRYGIARAVSELIPALSFQLPRPRAPWEREHPGMGVFAAAALAITFYRWQGAV